GERRDGVVVVDLANAMIQRVRDVEVAAIVCRNRTGRVYGRDRGLSAIAEKACVAVAADRVNQAFSGDYADTIVLRVGDKNLARVIHGDAARPVQLRLSGRLAVSRK